MKISKEILAILKFFDVSTSTNVVFMKILNVTSLVHFDKKKNTLYSLRYNKRHHKQKPIKNHQFLQLCLAR